MPSSIEKYNWSEWRPFPDPRMGGVLTAPYGLGLYQLKNFNTEELILFGIGKNCAYRMSSLLPKPLGQGTRNNEYKRMYLLENLSFIHYRTIAFTDEGMMKKTENELLALNVHKYNT